MLARCCTCDVEFDNSKGCIRGLTHLCSIKQSCLFIVKCKDLRRGNSSKRALIIHQSLERCEIFNSREGLFSR